MEVDYRTEVFKHMTSLGFELKIFDYLLLFLVAFLVLATVILTILKNIANYLFQKAEPKLDVKPIQKIRKISNLCFFYSIFLICSFGVLSAK